MQLFHYTGYFVRLVKVPKCHKNKFRKRTKPIYFQQSYSYGGTTGTHDNTKDLSSMKRINKQIVIRFNADKASSLQWNFRPEQAEIIVTPGETALAFYR